MSELRAFLWIELMTCCRREDLEDMLADPVYFQAIFHSLGQVKALYQAQAELGMANESIASKCFWIADGECVAANHLRE